MPQQGNPCPSASIRHGSIRSSAWLALWKLRAVLRDTGKAKESGPGALWVLWLQVSRQTSTRCVLRRSPWRRPGPQPMLRLGPQGLPSPAWPDPTGYLLLSAFLPDRQVGADTKKFVRSARLQEGYWLFRSVDSRRDNPPHIRWRGVCERGWRVLLLHVHPGPHSCRPPLPKLPPRNCQTEPNRRLLSFPGIARAAMAETTGRRAFPI